MANKTEIINVTVNGVDLAFYPKSHQCKSNGENLISVTTATSIIDKSAQLLVWSERLANEYAEDWLAEVCEDFPEHDSILNRAQIKELIKEAAAQHRLKKKEAATVGDIVHQFAHDFAKAKIDGTALPRVDEETAQQAINGINAFIDWVRKHKVEFKEFERLTYSKKHNYWGIFDALAIVDDELTLLDYKTSRSVYPEMMAQASAYYYALLEEGQKVKKADILHFDKETGEVTIHQVSNLKKAFEMFSSALKLRRLVNETKKDMEVK